MRRGRVRGERWAARPLLSAVVRLLVVGVPVAAALLVALVFSALVPRPASGWALLWWAGVLATSMGTLAVVDAAARRLLPLAALLQLSLLFPDQAPSRFSIARRAGSIGGLQRELAAAQELEEDAPPAQAAEVIISLVTALSVHDRRTRGHSERVHLYTDLLAEEMGLAPGERERLRWAAMLHDIGKLHIDTALLNKSGRPDDQEWERLRRHPEQGRRLIAPLVPWLGEWAHAVEQHHERWDGTGYPAGLAGRQISLAARIVSVADAYEVMTAPRAYKRPVGPEGARRELAACAGTQFDPAVVRAFYRVSLGRLRRWVWPTALTAVLPIAGRPANASLGAVPSAAAAVGAAGVLLLGGVGGTGGLPAPGGPEVAIGMEDEHGGAWDGDGTDGWVTGAIIEGLPAGPASDRVPTDAGAAATAPRAGSTPDDDSAGPGEEPVRVTRGTGAAEADPAAGTASGSDAPTSSRSGSTATDDAEDPPRAAPDSSQVAGAQPDSARADGDVRAPEQQPDDEAGGRDEVREGPPSAEDPASDGSGRNAPLARDDAARATGSGWLRIDVLGNDEGLDDGVRSLAVLVDPLEGGTARVSGEAIEYRPARGFSGTDRFRYQVCAEGGGCGTAWVSVRVRR